VRRKQEVRERVAPRPDAEVVERALFAEELDRLLHPQPFGLVVSEPT